MLYWPFFSLSREIADRQENRFYISVYDLLAAQGPINSYQGRRAIGGKQHLKQLCHGIATYGAGDRTRLPGVWRGSHVLSIGEHRAASR